jgi:hypothetical protein
MNLMLWLVAGGFAGWVGFRFIGANAGRGLLMSMVIGVCGAYLVQSGGADHGARLRWREPDGRRHDFPAVFCLIHCPCGRLPRPQTPCL